MRMRYLYCAVSAVCIGSLAAQAGQAQNRTITPSEMRQRMRDADAKRAANRKADEALKRRAMTKRNVPAERSRQATRDEVNAARMARQHTKRGPVNETDAARAARRKATEARWAQVRRERRARKAEEARRRHEATLRRHAAQQEKDRIADLKEKQKREELARERAARRARKR